MSTAQKGISSMMVLILTSLIILLAWEIGEYAQLYSETNNPNPYADLALHNCFGSNTTFDCYDQDEGTDFVDTPSTPSDRLIFSWQDDQKP